MKPIQTNAADFSIQWREVRNRHRQSNRKLSLLLTIIAAASQTLSATEAPNAGPWNVMVVPSSQTLFSTDARERFNKNCAGCHSKDGRAQTPVARQRHVRDLSECTLNDEEIVKQILGGTRGKTNAFKMPPFAEKLSQSEAETLVPLVRSFRPASSANPKPLNTEADERGPRLAGMVSFPGARYAVLEKAAFSRSYFVLTRWETHEGISLEAFDSAHSSVQIRLAGQNSARTLKINTPPPTPHPHRFFTSLFGSADDTRHELMLENVSTDLLLFFYGKLTGRTLLRYPGLPETSFTLSATAKDSAELVRILENLLTSKGIATMHDGEKFLQVVPAAQAQGHKIDVASTAAAPGYINEEPAGKRIFINLPQTPLLEAVKLYAAAGGRTLDVAGEPRVLDNMVSLTTQSALSTSECEHAFEVLLAWCGHKLVPASQDSLKIIAKARSSAEPE